MSKKQKVSRRILRHLGQVGMAILSTVVIVGSAGASDAADVAKTAKKAIAAEGGKEALNSALKVARGKPALSIAAAITCAACLPVAGAGASTGLCIACGILIAKTLG